MLAAVNVRVICQLPFAALLKRIGKKHAALLNVLHAVNVTQPLESLVSLMLYIGGFEGKMKNEREKSFL